jgi:oligosaccharide repeat unit polymerase
LAAKKCQYTEGKIVAIIFTSGLVMYYLFAMRFRKVSDAPLAIVLLVEYIMLGISGIVIAVTDVLGPVYQPSYLSALFLLTCIVLMIAGFQKFHSRDIGHIIGRIQGQRFLENLLICSQLFAIVFFVPFAISSFTGNANENRLNLSDKMELLGSYGLVNTFAGAASQLFSSSLVLAFIRLSATKKEDRSDLRALLLVLSSLSYVIYILAYVGRDGVVYWLMTATMLYVVFKNHLTPVDRTRIVAGGVIASALLLVPFLTITISRFFEADGGGTWSFLEYFGAQIHHFSDYSSIDRPMTFGVQNFPMIISAACTLSGVDCESWLDIKDIIFELYLTQNKEPWLFGTFISDFAADFGLIGTLILIALLSALANKLCTGYRQKGRLTLARLLLILILYLTPFWGIFYFRFSIANGFIVVNLLFIALVGLLQGVARSRRGSVTGH